MKALDEAATNEKQKKADEEAKKEGNLVDPGTKSEGKDVLDWRVLSYLVSMWAFHCEGAG